MEELKDPKAEIFQGVTIGVPTFGMISAGFLMSQVGMGIPIFTNIGYHFVQGKPVDVARNEIVQGALDAKNHWVFFRDDDTLVDRDALLKLIKRFPINQKTHPETEGNMIVGGVVYSKTQPPYPMIHIEGYTAGIEDWEVEDLFKCDIIGMGCTLIPTGVFRKVLPFVDEWVCANLSCPVNWNEYHKKEGNCPSCNNKLFPVYFKTIRQGDIVMTEDSYFCLKAKKAGVEVYSDCGVLTRHEHFNADPRLTTHYYYSKDLKMPVWQQQNMVFFWPDSERQEELRENETIPSFKGKKKHRKKNGKVKYNLGSGGLNKKGFINVDQNVESDFQCDVRDLAPLLREYGHADEITADHVLEHIPRLETLPTFRGWIKALKPGGKLKVEVPDAIWAAENFIKYAKNGKALDDFPQAVIYGAQRYPGDEHRAAIYEKRARAMVSACKNMIGKSKVEVVHPKTSNQQLVRIEVTKKK